MSFVTRLKPHKRHQCAVLDIALLEKKLVLTITLYIHQALFFDPVTEVFHIVTLLICGTSSSANKNGSYLVSEFPEVTLWIA